ncbi:hypothetical protein CANCADRAFT_44803 [Tortispora caseinolytica NRRL Y-17796]|uniref:Rab-GAP TBC domain-containing protein n=1 Tax=Tortispora caseinolytica NRRL Y-17796 TaxID=767744 RepID=A0A1E4THI0_9ASCO|nr:hypothetical protein CANCADRAFT_44803 [Tortispora caseinolytica NRRL Y-17796]
MSRNSPVRPPDASRPRPHSYVLPSHNHAYDDFEDISFRESSPVSSPAHDNSVSVSGSTYANTRKAPRPKTRSMQFPLPSPGNVSASSPALPDANYSFPMPMPRPPYAASANGGSPTPSSRRSSYISQKSINDTSLSHQLELEYDSDDEIPHDTIFWNVPLSPSISRVHLDVLASQQPVSRSLHDFIDEEDQSETPCDPNLLRASLSLSDGGSDTIPMHQRIKSWDRAVANLSEDARNLSMAYAEEFDLQQAERSDNILFNNSKVIKKPPLQLDISDVVETIPLSHEKERHMSRTRPAWLPPKSRSEEKRHVTEYKNMMKSFLSSEKKKKKKQVKESLDRDHIRVNDYKTWREIVSSSEAYQAAVQTEKLREMWWRGVAPDVREQVWKRQIGNSLAITHETYMRALKRANDAEDLAYEEENYDSTESRQNRRLFTMIKTDVETTLPEYHLFQKDERLHGDLISLLKSYAFYRTDIGYTTGMNYIAALLLIVLGGTEEAFSAMANILNRPLPMALYTHDTLLQEPYFKAFLEMFQRKLPSLYKHMRKVGLDPTEAIKPMLLPLFTLHTAPNITVRIWDVMFCYE